jgi:hypothetical protein
MKIINGYLVNNYVLEWSKFDNYASDDESLGSLFFVFFWKVIVLVNIV